MVTQKNIMDNIIHYWLDHLECYATFKFEKELFDSLDFDNSNTWELEDYTYIKTEVTKYIYKIIFMKDNYPVFAYYKWDRTQNIPTKDYVIVYGTGFKILTTDEIHHFILWYFIEHSHLRRFDICLDTSFHIKDIMKRFKDVKQKWAEFYDEEWGIATKYIWDKKVMNNKRNLIRIYNKILDIIASKKIKLFRDYFQFDSVTRIELEIRSELAKNISYEDIFKEDIQKSIFKNYLSRHTSLFNTISKEKLTLYKKREIDFESEEYQSIYYKVYRRNLLVWHAKTVYNLGFCPVRVLIDEWYLQDKTKRILGEDLVEHLWLMESKLKSIVRENRYRRHKTKNLLVNSSGYEGEW